MNPLEQDAGCKMDKLSKVLTVLMVIGIFYFSFMILDRSLSLIFGFNFQPYGDYVPPGFTIWGHFANGSVAALALFFVFKLYDHGRKKRSRFLIVLPFVIFAVIGALIPYLADAEHLAKNGMGDVLPIYLAANDIYVFLTGFLAYKAANSNLKKLILLLILGAGFVIVHFIFYAPAFPEFYWS